MSATKSAGEIFDRGGPELESCCAARTSDVFLIDKGIGKTAETGDDGNGAISQRAKLRETARFEARWHHKRIGAGLNQMSQTLVKAYENADLTRIGFRDLAKAALQIRVAIPQQCQLHSAIQDRRQACEKQIKPLLPRQSTDDAEQKGIRHDLQTQSLLQDRLVRGAALKAIDA